MKSQSLPESGKIKSFSSVIALTIITGGIYWFVYLCRSIRSIGQIVQYRKSDPAPQEMSTRLMWLAITFYGVAVTTRLYFDFLNPSGTPVEMSSEPDKAILAILADTALTIGIFNTVKTFLAISQLRLGIQSHTRDESKLFVVAVLARLASWMFPLVGLITIVCYIFITYGFVQRINSILAKDVTGKGSPGNGISGDTYAGKCSLCNHVNPSDGGFCEGCGACLYEVCPECNKDNWLDAVYCRFCLAELAIITCTECDGANRAGAAHCRFCGATLVKNQTS